MNVVESVRRSRVTGSLVGSDGSASMHGEHVELYSEEESSTGEEEEEEEEEEEVVVETYDIPESIENRPPTGGKVSTLHDRHKEATLQYAVPWKGLFPRGRKKSESEILRKFSEITLLI